MVACGKVKVYHTVSPKKSKFKIATCDQSEQIDYLLSQMKNKSVLDINILV